MALQHELCPVLLCSMFCLKNIMNMYVCGGRMDVRLGDPEYSWRFLAWSNPDPEGIRRMLNIVKAQVVFVYSC